jgi:putative drug exporter of the RND superfamily
MTGLLYRCGRLCARHRWVVIGLWIALAIGVTAAGNAVGTQNSDDLSIPGAQSTLAQDLLERDLPGQANGTNPVVLKATRGRIDDAANRGVVERTLARLRAEPGVKAAIDPFGAAGRGSISRDATTAYISVTLAEGPSELTAAEANRIIDATDRAAAAGLKVAVGGYLGQASSETGGDSSAGIGILAAIVILLFAFGTVTAMALPIVTALVSLAISLALIKLLGHVVAVPSVAPTLGTMIGLGVGIDYALFVVTRHKRNLREARLRAGAEEGGGAKHARRAEDANGAKRARRAEDVRAAQHAHGAAALAPDEIRESIARATATSGGAVAFAGGTVVIALVSLLASGIPFVGTMGYSAAVAVVVAVLAALTLLPALLGALGPRIDSLRVHVGRTHPDDRQPHGWRRFAEAVSHRPWGSMIAAAAVLLVLAAPVLDLRLGSSDSGELPKAATARQAYDLMAKEYGAGVNGPLLVGVKLSAPARDASDPRLVGLEQAIARTKGVATVSPAALDRRGTAAVISAVPTTGPTADATNALVDRLRDDVIPRYTRGKGMAVYVGGATAGFIDLADTISAKLPLMIFIVVALSSVLLLVAFRSVVLPLKAAVCNLLSVGAAYGVVTFVFQEGHGATLLGLDGAVPIASYVPLLMFAILFGLSMDYEVFLLSQIQEQHDTLRDTRKAVVEGLASTGRVITSAALIMVCVFGSFVLNGNVVIQQFGLGLAAAIAIDATIVRCLFVPAVMTLLGDRCWWLPGWLDRVLPRISVEGGAYFADRSETPPAPERVLERV